VRIIIDTDAGTLETHDLDETRRYELYGREAFEVLSREWVRVGWNERYSYTFSWLGRPIIQLPEDMVRLQEVVWKVRPDVIVETGIAHGGSLVYSASLCRAMGTGRVIGVDIEIRPNNRRAVEDHSLADLITLIEGDSAAPETVARVRGLIRPGESVLVILDSDHSFAHVTRELEAYAPLVTPGSFLIATDGVMEMLGDVPRGDPSWARDNPAAAARAFAELHPEFVHGAPEWTFNESALRQNVTHWPDAWLRRR
jgi:cephalosporin hydroxylase